MEHKRSRIQLTADQMQRQKALDALMTQAIEEEVAEQKALTAAQALGVDEKAISKKDGYLTKLDLAEIVEAQIKKQLDRFKEGYNKLNVEKGSFLDYRIGEGQSGTMENGDLRTYLGLSIILDGVAKLVFKTSYGFSHEAQLQDEGEWKLTLVNELLFNLIGGGISFVLDKLKAA